ncbi:MAG: hypothetical protein LUG62_10135 [Clostridiales bacterium]|nr:hypothetical protein [Clostridiales bacterium]
MAAGMTFTAQASANSSTTAEKTVYSENTEAYDKYQTLTYTSVNGTVYKNIQVLANEEETEFSLNFDYYGMEQNVKVVRTDEGQYKVLNAGFFETDGALVVKKAVSTEFWLSLS